ncbi:MAG: bifunctional diaminohydroxyphosphoribosylaminopyrimidine deaminase/5-amino-6-(5-phosphoribosylamino)uracil reductase RibD [Dehalococcoidia bacterium]
MDYMKRALTLARRALGTTSPNPAVGAVVVKDGHRVGEGHTLPPGQGHAEVVALQQAGERARGATLYTTLEPCAHQGRVSPCTQAIIAAGIAEVHLAMIDPNPIVNGRGRTELEAAGIRTSVGEREQEARKLQEAYLKWITMGMPFVTAKFAMSLDGKIATATGDSRWISSEAARRYTHRLRRRADAVLVGVNTMLRDDPRLTARDSQDRPLPHQPLRVVVDSGGRMPPTAGLLRQPSTTLVATARPDLGSVAALEAAGAQVVPLPEGERGRVDLASLLRLLGQREVVSVVAEGGGALLGSLFDQGLVDKVVAFVAPVVIGGAAAPTAVAGRGVRTLAEALRLRDVTLRRVGPDMMVVGYVKAP